MNYNSLMNKPTINYKELIGDNTVTEVGGITEEQFNTLLSTDLSSYYTKAQIDDLFSRSYVYREKSGSIVTFDCPASVNGIDKVVSEIVAVQAGTGDPSPENIRPISGWAGVNITKAGKNIWNMDSRTFQYSKINVGQALYFMQNSINTFSVYYGYTDGTDGSLSLSPNTKASFNVVKPLRYLAISQGAYDVLINQNKYIMLSLTDFTEMIPYNGTTYTTALKDENDQPLTCYGGQLVNENGVQTLTVTHGYIASYNGETLPSTWISDRDVYAEGTTPTTGAEVVYELATPTQIPQQSQAISTQSGTNNLWADNGDIEVKCLDRIIPAGE
jgi:hypothetical protein